MTHQYDFFKYKDETKKEIEKKCDRETKAQVNADRVDCLCIHSEEYKGFLVIHKENQREKRKLQ